MSIDLNDINQVNPLKLPLSQRGIISSASQKNKLGSSLKSVSILFRMYAMTCDNFWALATKETGNGYLLSKKNVS